MYTVEPLTCTHKGQNEVSVFERFPFHSGCCDDVAFTTPVTVKDVITGSLLSALIITTLYLCSTKWNASLTLAVTLQSWFACVGLYSGKPTFL